MHFTISQKDAENIIRERFNLHSDIPVVISRPRNRKPAKIKDNTDPILNRLTQFDIRPDNKIENIRSLRQIYANNGYNLGLAEAKSFVENWSQYLITYKAINKLPTYYRNGVMA